MPSFLRLFLSALALGTAARGAAAELPYRPGKAEYWDSVIGVTTDPAVRATGEWREDLYRRSFPGRTHWRTEEDGATLERTFTGSGLVLVLETHAPYVYTGSFNSGLLEVSLDGVVAHVLTLLTEPMEVVLYRGTNPAPRTVRLRHRVAPNGGRGARVIGFREIGAPTADLSFALSGEASDLMMDARLTVRRGEQVLRTLVQRNWVSGMIRLAGLPPGDGYTLQIEALGWEPRLVPLPPLHPESERILTPQHLRLDRGLLTDGVVSPRLGHPAVKRPGDSLLLRLAPVARTSEPRELTAVRWYQHIGDARRTVALWEGVRPIPADGAVTVELARGEYEGLGDLIIEGRGAAGRFESRAPRSLHLRPAFPDQPVILAAGHLDNWGQYQGEYMAVLAEVANLIRPDAVLFSNDVHPAYVAGGLQQLQVPHLTTIGNHSFGYETNPSSLDAGGQRRPGPATSASVTVGRTTQGYHHREPHHAWRDSANRSFDRWYGDPAGVFELSPDIAVLNYGWSWSPEHNAEAIAAAARDFAPYQNRRIRILNSYEGDPPADLVRRFGFALVHSAHAWPAAAKAFAPDPRRGGTDTHFRTADGRTVFVGKRSPDTFRLVRFANDRVASVTYAGHERNLFSLDRHRVAPLRVEFSSSGGVHRARLINGYEETLPACRIDWVLPRGNYAVTGADVRGTWHSDDGEWTVLSVALDAPAGESRDIEARPAAR